MDSYTIYAHINKNNGKTYIGQTKQTLSRRFRHNGEGYEKCGKFYKAIQEEGWNSFNHVILFENLTLEQADLIEEYLINKFNLCDDKNGYNSAKGGHGFTSIMSESISNSNRKNWEQGIYDNIKHPVYCVELNKSFESALEAERLTNIDNSGIQKACRGLLRYVGLSPQGQPLHWIFLENKNDELIKELFFRDETLKGVKIPVYCPELNELFNSTTDAFNKYKIDPSSIRKVIKGNKKSAGKHPITNEKLHWIARPDLIQTTNKITQERWDKLITN